MFLCSEKSSLKKIVAVVYAAEIMKEIVPAISFLPGGQGVAVLHADYQGLFKCMDWAWSDK